ncbi:hypothetical protein PC116_g33277 [Phytophthora cactorum]|nr:hypothetical protein PC116_g33277 [Phytophthora cactorum]
MPPLALLLLPLRQALLLLRRHRPSTRTSTGCLTGSQPRLVSRPHSLRTPFAVAERSMSTDVMGSRIAGSSIVAPGT